MEDDSKFLKNNSDRGGDPCDNNFYYFTVAVHAAIRSEQLHTDC